MRILALDTSTDACSVALLLDNVIFERFEVAPRQHTQLILPMIESLLAEAGISLSQVNAIAFGRGPGTFTGLRIAAGITQGLAFGANLPVIPVSTLQALAQGVYRRLNLTRVLAGIDARMNELYWGTYQLADNGLMELVGEETVSAPEKVILPTTLDWYGAGSGCEIYRDVLQAVLGRALVAIKENCYPLAYDIAKLATHAYQQGLTVPADQALPIYLRDKVVN